MRRFWHGILLLTAAAAMAEETVPKQLSTQTEALYPRACRQGLHLQPGGTFAALVFCDDALSTHLAVVCYRPGSCEAATDANGGKRFAGWQPDDRVWQQHQLWTSDVTALAWSPDGKTLYVSTGQIYGSGGLYALDLEGRSYRQLLPADRTVTGNTPGIGYTITALSDDGMHLTYETGEPPGKHTLDLAGTKP